VGAAAPNTHKVDPSLGIISFGVIVLGKMCSPMSPNSFAISVNGFIKDASIRIV